MVFWCGCRKRNYQPFEISPTITVCVNIVETKSTLLSQTYYLLGVVGHLHTMASGNAMYSN